MAKGDTWKSAVEKYKGERALKPTVNLTPGDAECHHLFGPTFADGGKTLLFTSGTPKRQNFRRMDLHTRHVTDITDARGIFAGGAWYVERAREIYYWELKLLKAVNIDTLAERVLYDGGFTGGSVTASCDGRFAATAVRCEDVSGFDREFVGRDAILLVSTRGDGAHPILTTPFEIGFLSFSTVDPDYLVYCWHGRAAAVPQRLWWTDISGVEGGPVGRQNPNEAREFGAFGASGDMVAAEGTRFHICRAEEGYYVEETGYFISLSGRHGRDRVIDMAGKPGRVHPSPSGEGFVCDAGGAFDPAEEAVSLIHISRGRGAFDPLFYHGTARDNEFTRPRPQFSPDGKSVVFAASFSGRSMIYLTSLD